MDVRSLLFGLLVLAMVAVGCSGDDDDAATPTTTASATTVAPSVTEAATTTTTTSVQEMEVSTTTVPSAEVVEGAFTFADDDLCEWVSVEMVAEFVGTEFDDPEVTVVVDDEGSGGSGCGWYFLASSAPDEFGSVRAHDAGSTWKGFSGGNHEYAETEGVEIGEEVRAITFSDGAVSGHPSLSDGVVVFDGGWGVYTFWVPPIDEYLDVSVSFPREEGDYWDEADYEARMFGVADRFVQELGWLG